MREAQVYYTCDGVFDGIEPRIQRGVGILVAEGRIRAIARPDDVPADVAHEQLPGFVVPGFADSHTHITIRPGKGRQLEQLEDPIPAQMVRGFANLARMLDSGVTHARILTERSGIDLAFRDAIAAGELPGPTLTVSGDGIAAPGGHGRAHGGVRGKAALEQLVATRADEGVDHIKVFATGGVSSTTGGLADASFTLDELRAIVDAADKRGLAVAAHAQAGSGIRLAATAGVRSIEHGTGIDQETADFMAEHGTWVVLTSSILFSPGGIEQGDAADPVIMEKLQAARRAAIEGARIVRGSGIRVAVGTDSMHGEIDREMRWMVEQGWTPAEALLAATSAGAEIRGVPGSTVLRPDNDATFVVLGADPMADIAATGDVRAVYQRGRRTDSHSPNHTS